MLLHMIDLINEHLALLGRAFVEPKALTAQEWFTLILLGVLDGLIALAILWQIGRRGRAWWLQRKLATDLHPFFDRHEIRKATRYYVATQCQDVSPATFEEPRSNIAFVSKVKLIPFFLTQAFRHNKDDHRYYLILADSGMGKTTFMINLYLRYVRQWWFRQHYYIRLVPLGHPKGWEEIQRLAADTTRAQNTILLLDAFDEDTEAVKNHRQRLGQIMEHVWRFREVVLTSRSQFFPTEKDEPNELHIPKLGGEPGFHKFWKKYVSPFDDTDIRRCVWKRFGLFRWKTRRKALRIVHNSPNLMVRPMLLNYIDDLLDTPIPFVRTNQTYEALITKWIDREARRYPEHKYEAFRMALWQFSKAIALDMYQHRTLRDGLFIPRANILPFAEDNALLLDDLEMRSRSLLNRDAVGHYKFAHKSILEYFLAYEAVENVAFGEALNFDGMEAAAQFYIELVLQKAEGVYTTHKSNRVLPLHAITSEDISSIKGITIKKIKGFDIKQLAKISTAKTITVFDHNELNFLYDLYIYHSYLLFLFLQFEPSRELRERRKLRERRSLQTRRKLRERRELQTLRELPELLERLERLELQGLRELPELRELQGLREWLERREQREQREWLELRELQEWRERLERLELRERLEQLERLQQQEWLEQLERRKFTFPRFQDASNEDFILLNRFVADMQYVQIQLPHCVVYY